MNSVRNYSQQPIIVGIIALILGILFGLIVLGWWLFPVQWTNGTPADLTYEYKVEYMRMSIDSFAVNGDAMLATTRYNSLGTDANQIYLDIATNPAGQSTEVIAAYGAVVGATGVPAEVTDPGSPTPIVTAEAIDEGGGFNSLIPFLCGFGLLLLLAAAGAAFYYFRWMRPSPSTRPTPSASVPVPMEEVVIEESIADQQDLTAPPVAQFMASYKLGDELYDNSFSIDSVVGEFLGECGVGVSETIGVGETQKVTAFEIWLFDKNDIQTVTKVLMSAHAFQDNDIRQRLAAKGEPVMVTAGGSTILETQTLYMMARIVDMGYGDGAMPIDSYFDRFIIELSVWSK